MIHGAPLPATMTLGGNRREVPRQNHIAYTSVQGPRWMHPWDVRRCRLVASRVGHLRAIPGHFRGGVAVRKALAC